MDPLQAAALQAVLLLPQHLLALLAADDARDVGVMACVSKAWKDAAAQPAVWRDLRFASPHPTRRARLTGDLLAALVARAGGALRSLDVTGCVELTDEGIVAALSHLTTLCSVTLCAAQPPASKYQEPRKIRDFCGNYDALPDEFNCSDEEREAQIAVAARPERTYEPHELGPTQLTAAGIAAALHASAPLEELCVDGFMQSRNALADLANLLPLVGGDAARLDVVLCGSAGNYWAFASCDAGEEGGCIRTWKEVVPRDGVPDENRCHKLRTRLEAACAERCQGCGYAYCAHMAGGHLYDYYDDEEAYMKKVRICGCNQRMCGKCCEDCQANTFF